jgi:hypothetical protein
MVHHSKSRIQHLTQFIIANVAAATNAFVISDVKQDGTVFVKFRSAGDRSGMDLAQEFNAALWRGQLKFTQLDDRTIRLALDQFPS